MSIATYGFEDDLLPVVGVLETLMFVFEIGGCSGNFIVDTIKT